MPNQYTKSAGKDKSLTEKDSSLLTHRQRRLLWNVASGRFKTVKDAGIDAGYALSSAMTNCQELVRQYADYVEELRQEFLAPQREQIQKDADMAKRILKELALTSENDQVRRLACRDILELAGELKAIKLDKGEDLTPKDLKAEAQRAAQGLLSQPMQGKVN